MTECAALKSKTYKYLIDDNDENMKAKGAKKFFIKRKVKCEDNKNSIKTNQLQKEIS